MLQFVSHVQKRVSALFGSFGDVERKFISAKAKGWIFMAEEKRFAGCNSAETGNRERKANILQRRSQKIRQFVLGVLFEMYAQTRKNRGC